MKDFMQEKQYDYTDALLEPQASDIDSRSKVKVEREFTFRHSKQVKRGTGIIAANMSTVGTIPMARAMVKQGMFTALHKHIPEDQLIALFKEADAKNYMFLTIGASIQDYHKLLRMCSYGAQPDMVCIDIANGYLDILTEQVRRVRTMFPNMIIMAGNVVTGGRTFDLIEAGADIVKVGIGPGSACTTRKLTGVGRPQLSAVLDCANMAEIQGASICADGGIVDVGDIGKALVAGADFVMLGGMLAGHYECDGVIIEYEKHLTSEVQVRIFNGQVNFCIDGKCYASTALLPESAWGKLPLEVPEMVFYGMSSETAMKNFNGGVAEYRAAEGRTVQIPYRGFVDATLVEILGGLRSTMTYVGCRNIEKMAHCTKFYPTNHQYNTVFVK